MARQVRKTVDTPKGQALLAGAEQTHKPFAWLKRATYNPKVHTDAQIDSICNSIVEFGIVDPLVVADDGEVLGGNSRHMAIEKLLAGKYQRKVSGKKVTVTWALPPDGVPVSIVHGLTPERRRILNVALTQTEGEFDHTRLAELLTSLNRDMGVDLESLTATGFTVPEITDYFDLVSNPAGSADSGNTPGPTKGAPKLGFDFSSPELRDAVKRAVAGKTPKDSKAPSGDVLAQLLGVSV